MRAVVIVRTTAEILRFRAWGVMLRVADATLQYRHPLIRLQPQVKDSADPLSTEPMAREQDQRIADVVTRE